MAFCSERDPRRLPLFRRRYLSPSFRGIQWKQSLLQSGVCAIFRRSLAQLLDTGDLIRQHDVQDQALAIKNEWCFDRDKQGIKGLAAPFRCTPNPCRSSSASLRTISLDDSEHSLHNHRVSVASLRLLFTFAPECPSASRRNRCSPSPEYPVLHDDYVQADSILVPRPLLEHGSTQGWQIVLQMTAVGFRVNRGTDLFPDPHVIAWARRHNALPR